MSIKERLIQFVLRGKDELSPEAKKSAEALELLKSEALSLGKALDSTKAAQGLAKGLEATRRAAEQSERALVQTDLQIKELREALNKNPEGAGLAQSLKDAEREGRKLQRQLDQLKTSLGEQERAAKEAGIDTEDLATEQQRLAAELVKAKGAVDNNKDAIKKLEAEQAKAARTSAEQAAQTGKVTGALESAGKKVLAFAAAYISLNAAMGLVRSGLRLVASGIESVLTVGDRFESLDKRFASLMGSMAEGEKATAWIRKFADDTGQRVPEVAEAFAMLKSYGLDPLDGSMQAITDKAAQLGGGLEVMQGITMALGQMWSKEKIQQEEVLQLVERGVSVWPLLSNALGKTVPELQALATQGKLGRDAIKVLMDEIGKSANGSAAGALDTLAGKANVLRNAFEDFARNIAKSGAMDAVKDRLQSLADKLHEMADDGSLDRFAQKLSDAFVDGLEWVESFAGKVSEFDFKGWANKAADSLINFREKLDWLSRGVELLSAPFRAMADMWVISTGICIKQVLRLVAVTQESAAILAKALPDAFGGKAVEESLNKQAKATRAWMEKITAEVDGSTSSIKENWRSITGVAEETAKKSTDAFVDAGKKLRDELVRQGQDIETHFRTNLTGIDNALAAIAFAETTEHLEQIERAMTQAGLAGRMSAQEIAQGLVAIEQRRPFVAVVEGAQTATRSISDLRQEQALLAQQYQQNEISLQAWQDGHNALTQEIRNLEQGTVAAVAAIEGYKQAQDAISTAKTVAELEAVKKALFDAYQNKDLNLEQFQALHNQASTLIRQMGGAASDTKRDIAGLDDALDSLQKVQSAISSARTDVDITKIRAALKKLYDTGKVDADQYAQAQEELNQKVRDLKPAAEASTKSVAQQRKELGKTMEETRRGMRDLGDETEEASTGMDFFGRVLTAAREPLAAMSQAALLLYDNLRGIKQTDVGIDMSSAEKSAASLAKVREEAGGLRAELAQISGKDWGFGIWARQTVLASKEVQAQFLEQKLALQELNEQYENGQIGAAGFARAAQSMRNNLKLLDESDLSQLDSALASAQQRMEQLGESSKSTLDSLQDELDKLEGRETDIENRRMARRRRELEAQLAEAQKDGDTSSVSNLQKALQTLAQISAATAQQRQQADQQKLIDERAAKAPAPQTAQQPAQIIRLESKGKTVEVAVQDSSDKTNLLSILEDAGLRSI